MVPQWVSFFRSEASSFMLKMSSRSLAESLRSPIGVVREELKMMREPSADQCG